MNHGNETLVSDECKNDHFIEIGLSKPTDWDNEDWLCDPVDIENETDIGDEEEERKAEKENEEEKKGGAEEATPTGIGGVANAPNDPEIEATSPLPAYLRFQWGPTREYQALFKCNLPTLAPEAFQVKLHRLGTGLEDEHPHDISIYARSHDHGDEIILDDNGIPLLVVFIEWSGGGGTRYGALTRAYAKRTVGDKAPVLSSEEIGRMLGPWRKMLRKDVWKLDATIEESWMKSGALEASALASASTIT